MACENDGSFSFARDRDAREFFRTILGEVSFFLTQLLGPRESSPAVFLYDVNKDTQSQSAAGRRTGASIDDRACLFEFSGYLAPRVCAETRKREYEETYRNAHRNTKMVDRKRKREKKNAQFIDILEALRFNKADVCFF